MWKRAGIVGLTLIGMVAAGCGQAPVGGAVNASEAGGMQAKMFDSFSGEVGPFEGWDTGIDHLTLTLTAKAPLQPTVVATTLGVSVKGEDGFLGVIYLGKDGALYLSDASRPAYFKIGTYSVSGLPKVGVALKYKLDSGVRLSAERKGLGRNQGQIKLELARKLTAASAPDLFPVR
ncbi:hypothetical protein J7643_04390 [bacterium]|nr:hypothetical protein [bacterium]